MKQMQFETALFVSQMRLGNIFEGKQMPKAMLGSRAQEWLTEEYAI